MGSATREALAAAKDRLSSVSQTIDLATGESLLAAGRVMGESAQLRSALTDPAIDAEAKAGLVGRVFAGALGQDALGLLSGIVSSRWSSADDLLAGVEEIGIRAAAASAPLGADVDGELLAFGAVVASNDELELALGSKLGRAKDKVALARTLLEGKSSPQTLAIVTHLVEQPRGRRIGQMLTSAASLVADQGGQSIATVTSAKPLPVAQLERLRSGLSRQYGRSLRMNEVIDPSILGGVRVQVGDDVIDGSIAARLNDLRLSLAG